MGGNPPPPFDAYRIRVDGLATVLKKLPNIKAYVHPEDIHEIMKANPETTIDRFQPTVDGFTLTLPLGSPPEQASTSLKFIHTPGHTPGSQCILLGNASLFSGDTIFVGSCGRMDFPESNPNHMWDSLSFTLKGLDDSVINRFDAKEKLTCRLVCIRDTHIMET